MTAEFALDLIEWPERANLAVLYDEPRAGGDWTGMDFEVIEACGGQRLIFDRLPTMYRVRSVPYLPVEDHPVRTRPDGVVPATLDLVYITKTPKWVWRIRGWTRTRWNRTKRLWQAASN